MPSTETDYSELKNVNYELFLVAITVIYFINLPLNIWAPTPEMRLVIQIIDTGFFVIFIGDFLYRLFSAKSKPNYFLRQYGWLDLLGSLPISGVRLARGVRSVRTVRLLQQYGVKNMGSELRRDLAGSTLILVFFMGILVLELGSYFIIGAEVTAANANILTASDALWWSVVTIATVGYGDRFPVTNEGRIIGAFVILTGVGLFSAFTGYLAHSFINRRKRRNRLGMHFNAQPDDPLDEIRQILEEQGKLLASIEKRLPPSPQEDTPNDAHLTE